MISKFTKMQGLGNTFLIIEGPANLNATQIQDYCSMENVDGLLLVNSMDDQFVEMKYWNADGSAAEMCGNGLRCVTRFAVDNNLVMPGEFRVKTDAGILKVVWGGKDSNKIEVQVGLVELGTSVSLHGFKFYEAYVGNPHAVSFVDNMQTAQVKKVGPLVEKDKHFPNRTNVEFTEVVSDNKLRLRVWERGVGETLACGTGMVAAAAVCANQSLIRYPVEVEVLGGSAKIWVDDEGFSRMLGPAEIME